MLSELLVPLDGSPLADAAVPHAVELARRVGGALHLVRAHVPAAAIASPPEAAIFIPDPSWDVQLREDTRTWLAQRAQEVRKRFDLPTSFELCVGTPVDEIVRVAEERAVRAIVCSTHGLGGWAPHWLGSVADGVIRRAPCPVFAMSEAAVARGEEIRKLLVLLDGSDVSEAIVPHAAWLARAFGAEIHMLRVVAPPWVGDSLTALTAGEEDPFGVDAFADAAKRTLEQITSALRRKGFSVTSTVQIHLSPARAILEHINETNPDAIALATYGRGLSRLFLGSVADKVLRAGGRPTLLFRPRQPAPDALEAVEPAHAESFTASGPA
ncbi:MAG TPA: universal stress protein [Gemmatimonadaceae bacterium]|nr:universal stress protein [Gemmatimonadaceae bacterium]